MVTCANIRILQGQKNIHPIIFVLIMKYKLCIVPYKISYKVYSFLTRGTRGLGIDLSSLSISNRT